MADDAVGRRLLTRSRVTAAGAWALAAVFVVTGTLHFTSPDGFERIVPRLLGSPWFWVAISGVAELGCAVLLAVPRTRRAGGWASVVLLIAVYPANVTMAVQSLNGEGSVLVAWLRLPLQVPLVLWAWWIGGGGQLRWPVSFTRRTDDVPSSQ